MHIHAARSCEAIAHAASKFVNSGIFGGAVADMTLHIGPSNDPTYRVPAAARDAVFIGDGAHIGNLVASSQLRALYAQNKDAVQLMPRWNSETEKWDMHAKAVPIGDAAPDLLGAQTIAPWNQGFFTDIFSRPLLYSKASQLVQREAGSHPWCEVMNLYLADFGGDAIAPNGAGSPDGNMTKDVTATSGMMTNIVVNMFVTYSLSMEELEASKDSGNPFGKKLIAQKIKYADYVLQMLTDYLTYYGNAETETQGLFNINSIESYTGSSVATIIADATDTTKGSHIYQNLAQIVNKFFSDAYNKFDHIKIGMSTWLYNQLSSIPYSDGYSPKSVLAVFKENYNGGQTKEGTIPRVEFYPDPLLDATTVYNPAAYDYMVITADAIGTGPEDTKQKVILQGMPLKEFVYPVVPGQINTQHRMLRRYAGIYAPVKESVKVISGFGK